MWSGLAKIQGASAFGAAFSIHGVTSDSGNLVLFIRE